MLPTTTHATMPIVLSSISAATYSRAILITGWSRVKLIHRSGLNGLVDSAFDDVESLLASEVYPDRETATNVMLRYMNNSEHLNRLTLRYLDSNGVEIAETFDPREWGGGALSKEPSF